MKDTFIEIPKNILHTDLTFLYIYFQMVRLNLLNIINKFDK